jgi:uncharacterized protein (DUF3084 family)
MPLAFVDIAERLGYPIAVVGNRRVINYQAALTSSLGTADSGNGLTVAGKPNAAASSDVAKVSALSQDLHNAISLFSQKEQVLTEQIVSLQGVVTALSAGQGSLQRQQEVLSGKLAEQAANSLAVLQSLARLRTDFDATREKHERAIAAGEAQYQATMDEFKRQLAVVEKGVKGPHDNTMDQ